LQRTICESFARLGWTQHSRPQLELQSSRRVPSGCSITILPVSLARETATSTSRSTFRTSNDAAAPASDIDEFHLAVNSVGVGGKAPPARR
jgi:hypothetical protein